MVSEKSESHEPHVPGQLPLEEKDDVLTNET
jgi:hypothetical protein